MSGRHSCNDFPFIEILITYFGAFMDEFIPVNTSLHSSVLADAGADAVGTALADAAGTALADAAGTADRVVAALVLATVESYPGLKVRRTKLEIYANASQNIVLVLVDGAPALLILIFILPDMLYYPPNLNSMKYVIIPTIKSLIIA
jgi:hypothetical protein